MNQLDVSPLSVWKEHCAKHQLAFQKDSQGRAIFFPRVVSPALGDRSLSWHVSAGLGTVYSVTTMYAKGVATGNVALIDLDEGFRMLSTIRVADPDQLSIGMRVGVQFEPAADPDAAPIPVFVPLTKV